MLLIKPYNIEINTKDDAIKALNDWCSPCERLICDRCTGKNASDCEVIQQLIIELFSNKQ